ncbi:MAG: nucleoside hydrolase [Chloroflexota bacterium]|nr:nucleoside hydrolase [Chloroflexota bacterium]
MTSIAAEHLARKTPIVLDCDPGVDDAMAILYGLRAPEVEIVALGTVWGNIDIDAATMNAVRLLEIGGRPDIPVAKGAGKQLIGEEPIFAKFFHGPSGTGGAVLPPPAGQHTDEHAVAQMIRLSYDRPGELTLVAVGPLTNLAIALATDPGIATRYKEVVIMGGACLIPGNVTPVAEANIWHDPEAAQMVLEAPWQVTLVPLDVTEHALVSGTMFDQLRDTNTPVGHHLHEISDIYLNAYEARLSRRASPMHDALALGIAVDPSLIETAPLTRIDVELNGAQTRGMTVADLRPIPNLERANARVVMKADSTRFVKRWFDVLASWD